METGLFAISCDTADPNALGILDCNGACWPADYVGDGIICDDGTLRPWGDPDFDCAAFNWDGGDCAPPTDTAPPADTASADTGGTP